MFTFSSFLLFDELPLPRVEYHEALNHRDYKKGEGIRIKSTITLMIY